MKNWVKEKLQGNEKIISAAVTIPIIAAGTISGVCAAGCPYGLVNDPYPGQCPRYIDVTGMVSVIYHKQLHQHLHPHLHDTTNADTNNQASLDGTSQDSSLNQNDSVNASAADSGSNLNSFGDGGGYHVLPVSILLLGGYFFTHFLFSKGILSRQKHRRLWNLLLTAGYAGTGITGILIGFDD